MQRFVAKPGLARVVVEVRSPFACGGGDHVTSA